jgi:type II secretory pathway pseudopilin PulG
MMLPRTSNHSNHRAMTLLEVFVVLSVIAILIGMLAPALSGVRMAGRATLCQSNLRQMQLAAVAYSNLYNAYPVAVRYDNSDGDFKTISWDYVSAGGKAISPGSLWQFTSNPDRVMQCPEYIGASNAPGDQFTGFNYSPYLGGEEPFSTNPGWHKVKGGVKPDLIRRSSEIAMFGCGGYKSGANKYMRSPEHNSHSEVVLAQPTIYSGGQAFRYRGATFVAYVDGHIGSSHHPERGVNATEALLAQFMDYPRNGFISEDASAYDPLR